MSQDNPGNLPVKASRRSPERRQLVLFPRPVPANWERLRSDSLPLNQDEYLVLRQCYQDVYESYLPGPNVTPFYTQVADALREREFRFNVKPGHIIQLTKRARELGIDDFPDVRARSVSSSSPEATRLRGPGAPVRMSLEEYNAFAEVYRDLRREGYPKKGKGQGFFDEAVARMRDRGFAFSRQNLQSFASYRRRLGDVNFPRLRGSHELDRMHVAAVDRIQALGVMATGLMHEILQPLQIILGEAELQKRAVTRNSLDPAKIEQRMEAIVGQVRKLSDVVQHVRTIARAGEPKLGPVDLRSAAQNALSLFLNQLRGKGIAVHLEDLPAELPPINADGVAVERIFINLLTNARDAIEQTRRGEGTVRISAHVSGATVICEVSDDGVGIAEANLARVFDPYFTTKEVGQGTGLGLTEVMNLMVQFGGRVTVQSVPHHSTTFRLEFPRYVENP
jgi:signal transduction histidine kinase